MSISLQESILDSIPDGVFTVDRDFLITFINRAGADILGINRNEALGKYCYEIFHTNICEHSCALRQTMATGEDVINRTIYVVNGEGEKIPVSISTSLLKDSKGDVIGGVESFRDISDVVELRKTLESSYTIEDIVSKNKTMLELFAILPDIAESDSSVIVQGESGTGKELVARAIHNLSRRRDKPLIALNCGAIPETLIESELFGYKAGAFTDAKRDKPGKIAMAEGGSLFLDEVAELSPQVQVKILRFLQERAYDPLGSVESRKADVRIIAATNRSLEQEISSGNFRSDLFYRLSVVSLELPPLRSRIEDIPLLVGHFIRRYNHLKGKGVEGVSDEAMNILLDHDYPGNIRELENIIEHAFVLCKEHYIQPWHLPQYLKPGSRGDYRGMTLEEVERRQILRVLAETGGSRNRAASILGINPSTLWRKLKRYKIIANCNE